MDTSQLNISQLIKAYPELIIEAAQKATSMTDLLVALNFSKTNTTARKNIKEFLEQENVPIPNGVVAYSSKEKSERRILTKETILERFVKGNKTYGSTLNKWVKDYDLLPYKCSIEDCVLSVSENMIWNGKPINLDLDHVNGDSTDNRLENLRYLCPNCHSQTETYKGRNMKNKRKPLVLPTSRKELLDNFNNLPSPKDLEKEVKLAGSLYSVALKYSVSIYSIKNRISGKVN
jgi:hypothetical protein